MTPHKSVKAGCKWKFILFDIISVLGSSSEDVSYVWFSPVMEHLFFNLLQIAFHSHRYYCHRICLKIVLFLKTMQSQNHLWEPVSVIGFERSLTISHAWETRFEIRNHSNWTVDRISHWKHRVGRVILWSTSNQNGIDPNTPFVHIIYILSLYSLSTIDYFIQEKEIQLLQTGKSKPLRNATCCCLTSRIQQLQKTYPDNVKAAHWWDVLPATWFTWSKQKMLTKSCRAVLKRLISPSALQSNRKRLLPVKYTANNFPNWSSRYRVHVYCPPQVI